MKPTQGRCAGTMDRGQRRRLGLAVLLAAAASIATKPTPKGWRMTAPAAAQQAPNRLVLTQDQPSGSHRYAVHLNARARGKHQKPAAHELQVRLAIDSTWHGAASPPAVLIVEITGRGDQVLSHSKVAVRPGVGSTTNEYLTIPLEHCGAAAPCDAEFTIHARWLHADNGTLDVHWTMNLTAFAPTGTRRDQDAPTGAEVTISNALSSR